jgi:hypothetical protein
LNTEQEKLLLYLLGPLCIISDSREEKYFIRENTVLSSERMLHKDYDRKGSVEKKDSDRESQGA